MTQQFDATRVASVFDRMQISETIYRYHRAFDSRDWDRCRLCLTDPVEVETTGPGGAAASGRSFARDHLIKVLQRMNQPGETHQHFSSNHVIKIDGDQAVCSAYTYVKTIKPDQDGTPQAQTTGALYTFDLSRSADGWQIRKYRADILWTETGAR